MEASSIAAGLGALGLAKQLRRINESGSEKKIGVMRNVMKAAAAEGINPKEALKKAAGKQ